MRIVKIIFLLAKKGVLCKSDNKSKLERTTEEKLEQSSTRIIPSKTKKSRFVIAFLICGKKVRVKKDNEKQLVIFAKKFNI